MNRIERPQTNINKYSQHIFDKGGKAIQWSKGSVFNKWCWYNWTSTDLTLLTKVNSRWILHLHVKYKTIKHLEEYTGEKSGLGLGDECLFFCVCVFFFSHSLPTVYIWDFRSLKSQSVVLVPWQRLSQRETWSSVKEQERIGETRVHRLCEVRVMIL